MDNFDLYGIDEPDFAPEDPILDEVPDPDPWMVADPDRGLLDPDFELI